MRWAPSGTRRAASASTCSRTPRTRTPTTSTRSTRTRRRWRRIGPCRTTRCGAGWLTRWTAPRSQPVAPPSSPRTAATGARRSDGRIRLRIWAGTDAPASPVACCESAERLALQELLGQSLYLRGLHLSLVGLHDVAHQAPHLLDVGDPERPDALLDQRAHRRLIEPLGQVALAECDLEAKLRRLLGPAFACLLVLPDGLLKELAVGPDHVEDQGVVHRAREILGRSPLLETRLEHAHDVGGGRVLRLDRLGQPVVQLLLEAHADRRGLFTPRAPSPSCVAPGRTNGHDARWWWSSPWLSSSCVSGGTASVGGRDRREYSTRPAGGSYTGRP